MKASSGYSGPTGTAPGSEPPSPVSRRPRPAPPSLAVEAFAITGRSERPDPAVHAYRADLADIALTGRVIASHYAEPLLRHLKSAAPVMAGREPDAEMLVTLNAGDELHILDCSLGWAWGYAGPERCVGYIRVEAVGA